MGFDSGCLTLVKEAVIIYSHMAISEAGLGRAQFLGTTAVIGMNS